MRLLDNVLDNTVGTDVIAPWNASLEPTKAIIQQLEGNDVLTGVGNREVNAQTFMPDTYDNIILPDASLTRMSNATITNSNNRTFSSINIRLKYFLLQHSIHLKFRNYLFHYLLAVAFSVVALVIK